jgi:hypothetical protein
MEKARFRALRHAQLYGYLTNRTGRLYYPGGSHPVCSEQTAHEMVRAGGWSGEVVDTRLHLWGCRSWNWSPHGRIVSSDNWPIRASAGKRKSGLPRLVPRSQPRGGAGRCVASVEPLARRTRRRPFRKARYTQTLKFLFCRDYRRAFDAGHFRLVADRSCCDFCPSAGLCRQSRQGRAGGRQCLTRITGSCWLMRPMTRGIRRTV